MNTFARAHSLEIPDTDEDTLQLDWDLELDDVSDESGAWVGFPEMAISFEDMHTGALDQHASHCTPELHQSTGSVEALAANSSCSRGSSPQTSKRTKRVSAKKKIENLRDEIKELTVKLQTLGGHQEKCSAVPPKTSTSQLWKQIAKRQQEQRELSEEENRKLREMMEVQTLEAKSLQQVLKRRKKLAMLGSTLGVESFHKESSTHLPALPM